jgi:hypothetical protein
MRWTVEFHPAFEAEFDAWSRQAKTAIAAKARLIEEFGPHLGRPHVDTLEGSRHANLKELRCNADNGVWRVVFAFDPDRKAILLVGADKSGGNEKRFYKKLIAEADVRFDDHLQALKGKEPWAPR